MGLFRPRVLALPGRGQVHLAQDVRAELLVEAEVPGKALTSGAARATAGTPESDY